MTDSQSAEYSSFEEFHALYPGLSPVSAGTIWAETLSLIDHGHHEPQGVPDFEDDSAWVEEGQGKLVSV
jgi:hypothetical protein